MEFFTYEQVVCAAIACYKEYLGKKEISDLINEICQLNPELVFACDGIRVSGEYITFYDGVAFLNEETPLDMNVQYNGSTLTVGDILKTYAGDKLVAFMEHKKLELADTTPQM